MEQRELEVLDWLQSLDSGELVAERNREHPELGVPVLLGSVGLCQDDEPLRVAPNLYTEMYWLSSSCSRALWTSRPWILRLFSVPSLRAHRS